MTRMTETNQDFTWQQNDSKELRIDVTKDDGSEKDLSGATIKWGMAPEEGSATIITKSSGDGEITIADDDGTGTKSTAVVTLNGADNADVDPGVYYHELHVDDGSNDTTPTTGDVTIKPDTVS